MNPYMPILLGVIMDACDDNAEAPMPAAGEAVTAYWIRVLKYQVWADSHDHCSSIGCPNPYEEANLS